MNQCYLSKIPTENLKGYPQLLNHSDCAFLNCRSCDGHSVLFIWSLSYELHFGGKTKKSDASVHCVNGYAAFCNSENEVCIENLSNATNCVINPSSVE